MEEIVTEELVTLKAQAEKLVKFFEVKDLAELVAQTEQVGDIFKELKAIEFEERHFSKTRPRVLTDHQFSELLRKDFGNLSQKEIGKLYGISQQRVCKIFELARKSGLRK